MACFWRITTAGAEGSGWGMTGCLGWGSEGFQNGVVVFDTRDMPAGMYLVRIATEEGRGVTKVMIGH